MNANEIQLSNVQDWCYALQQRNLVYNYDFTLFSNQTTSGTTFNYGHPDGWVYEDQGTDGSIGFNTSLDACKIVTSSTAGSMMAFSQALHEFPRWENYLQGTVVTAVVELTISTKSTVTLQLEDGLDASAKQITDSGSLVLEVSHMVASGATELILSLLCSDASVSLNVTKVYANRGSIALESLPCMVSGVIGERRQYISTEIPPATELSLCQVSQELLPSYSRLSSFLNGKFGFGPNKLSMLPDMRGYFSRAWDHDSGTDPDASSRTALGNGTTTGDNVGTVEEDQYLAHNHVLDFSMTGQIPGGTSPVTGSLIPMSTPSSNTEDSGGKETRGKNIAELYTIKWA